MAYPKKPDLRSNEERNALVMANQGLLYKVVFETRRSSAFIRMRLPEDDAIQVGELAMLDAARLWDPERTRFSTYASNCIRRRLMWTARESGLIRVPDWVQDEMVNVERYGKPRYHKREIYERCRAHADKANYCERLSYHGGRSIPARVRDDAEDSRLDRLMELLKGLSAADINLLIKRFWEGKYYHEIAAEEGVTKQAVQLRQKAIIEELRSQFA